jgi:predicted transcriptional regulator
LEKGLRKEHQKELGGDVEKEKRRSCFYYRITDNGRRFLQIYGDLCEMIMIA